MRMGTAKLRNNIAEAVNRAVYGGERIILERRGKALAAIVSLADLRLIEELEDKADVAAARKARAEGGRPVPLEEVAARLGIDLERTGEARTRRPKTTARRRSA